MTVRLPHLAWVATPVGQRDKMGQVSYPQSAMSISKAEAKQLLERMIFDATEPQDWVQDVWGLSPLMGDSAAKLLEAFYILIDCCPDDQLDNLVKGLYREQLEF